MEKRWRKKRQREGGESQVAKYCNVQPGYKTRSGGEEGGGGGGKVEWEGDGMGMRGGRETLCE